jgi:hypothetical protein
MNLWTIPFAGLLALVTVVHVVHAMSAAYWVYVRGADWYEEFTEEEARIRMTSPERSWTLEILKTRIRLYDKYGAQSCIRFFGVKSYRLQDAALRARSKWKRRLRLWLRFVWRWNRYAPGVALIVIAVSVIPTQLPLATQLLLWITAMLLVLGMATIAVEGVFAAVNFGSWAEDHHGWRRVGRSDSSISISGVAIWLGCAVFAWLASSSLAAVTVFQLHGYGSFAADTFWLSQIWDALTLALPWTPIGAPTVHIANVFGSIFGVAVPILYFVYIAIFLQAALTRPTRKTRRE